MLSHLRWAKGCIDAKLVRGARRKAEGSKAKHPRRYEVLLERSLAPTRELSAPQHPRTQTSAWRPRGPFSKPFPKGQARPRSPGRAMGRIQTDTPSQCSRSPKKPQGLLTVEPPETQCLNMTWHFDGVAASCGQQAAVQLDACAFLTRSPISEALSLSRALMRFSRWPRQDIEGDGLVGADGLAGRSL